MWVTEAQSDVVRRWARQLFLHEAVWGWSRGDDGRRDDAPQ